MRATGDAAHDFWMAAEPMLEGGAVTRATMMGLPCLQAAARLFAAAHRPSGDLVVTRPASRVEALLEAGEGVPFAPAGRRFRKWVRIPDRSTERWQALMHEALSFVASIQ